MVCARLAKTCGITIDRGCFRRLGCTLLAGPCWLRTTRTLDEGMVLTVEPGCYFNMPWIQEQFRTHPHKRDYVDEAVLERFASFGGVRLEDDVVVTADGIDNLTVVPRELEDVEEVLNLAHAARAPSQAATSASGTGGGAAVTPP